MRHIIWAVIAACATPAFAQTSASIPRDAAGHPDLGGVWDADFITPLQRPEKISALIVPPEGEAEALKEMAIKPGKVYDPDFEFFMPDKLLKLDGAMRSSWIIAPADGHLPFTALAKAADKRAGDDWSSSFDNPEERPGSERCIDSLAHPPLTAISRVIPSQIVQTPAAILIVTEDTDGARIIHMDGAPPPDAVRSRGGYSIGHWEGDTLVVVTTHLDVTDPAGALYRNEALVSRASTITEWLTLTAKDELRYRFTIADPALYDRPWLAEYPFKRIDDRIYEYACHENNYAFANILHIARLGKQTSLKPPPDKDAKDGDAKDKDAKDKGAKPDPAKKPG